MIETVMYEFDGLRWVPVARAMLAECGHVHWVYIGRHQFRALREYDARNVTVSWGGRPCVCWRGVS